jgi:hypothetical protein
MPSAVYSHEMNVSVNDEVIKIKTWRKLLYFAEHVTHHSQNGYRISWYVA